MRIFILFLAAITITLGSSSFAKEMTESDRAYQDIRKTIGEVPLFMKRVPKSTIMGAWQEFKMLHLGSTVIPNKYKELISLGVAAQIPCRYCVYFHTQTAKLHGATEEEINEFLMSAATTRKWSTWLHGSQLDLSSFKKDIRNMTKAMTNSKKATPVNIVLNDPRSVYEDVKNHFGFVPSFIRSYPQSALVPAWKAFKSVEIGPTASPRKYRSLVNVAVASQIPCEYCTFSGSEFARANGSTSAELSESILLAAQVRQWSTILNGIDMDDDDFQDEIDDVISFVKKQSELAE